ncbi:MAG: hypothetical protein CME68_05905 [Halobacteriovoraceae bacterium]|nr:hypothetical protein [Halobacteriovoraceae bacterium]|tara:strand:- start:859 stop:1299 length:441 start_codon:yes stop_codon:yes gene_type:complete
MSISFFEDKEGHTEFSEIRNKKFKNVKLFKTFFSGSTFWFKVILNESKTELEENLFLTLEKPTIDHITFFRHKEGKWLKTITGGSKPFHSREIENRNFVFKLKRINKKQTYFIKVKSFSSLLFPIYISTKNELDKNKNRELRNRFN